MPVFCYLLFVFLANHHKHAQKRVQLRLRRASRCVCQKQSQSFTAWSVTAFLPSLPKSAQPCVQWVGSASVTCKHVRSWPQGTFTPSHSLAMHRSTPPTSSNSACVGHQNLTNQAVPCHCLVCFCVTAVRRTSLKRRKRRYKRKSLLEDWGGVCSFILPFINHLCSVKL